MKLQNWWFTTLMNIDDKIQPPLTTDIKTDFLVIGGGAAGLSAAYSLINKGLNVVLIEKNICGGNTTGKSAGFLTPDSELEIAQLLRRYGPENAKFLWEVAQKGVQLIVSHVNEHKINCDLQKQDSLFLGNGKSGLQDVISEMETRKKLGYTQQFYAATELRSVLGSNAYSGGVRYPDTYGIDALQYAQEMKRILLENGVKIYESTEALSINDHKVTTRFGSVTASEIIFCADKPTPSLTHFSNSVFHAQTFLTISEPLTDKIINELFPSERFLCWDTDFIYTYFRLTGDNRILLGGGSVLTTFTRNDVNSSHVIRHVIKKFKQKFPILKDLEFIQFWPGRIDTTRDLMPTIVKETHKPWIHFVLGCVGLPWATFCGDFAARHAYDDKGCTDHDCYNFFNAERYFLLPLRLEKLIGKPPLFALNNGWAKYYQRDEIRKKIKEQKEG
jgi:gamma-glutamylputrescine oxidase